MHPGLDSHEAHTVELRTLGTAQTLIFTAHEKLGKQAANDSAVGLRRQ